jgi:hypothetical protein
LLVPQRAKYTHGEIMTRVS